MKKLFVIVIMLAATVSLVTAQQEGRRQQERRQGQMMTPEERAKAIVGRLSNNLSLTDDQKAQIEVIELDINKQMDEKQQNIRSDREARVALFQEFDKIREKKYRDVLTAEQFKKYSDEKTANRRQRPMR